MAAESGQGRIARDLLARGGGPAIATRDGTTLGTVVERSRASYAADADFQAVASAVR